MRAISVALFAAAAGCTLEPLSPPAPQDPFAEGASFALVDPARAAAVLEPVADAGGPLDGPRPVIALAREIQDDVQILAADSDGILYEQDPAPAGEGPRDVAALDVDGDGELDIVAADTGGSALTVLLRTPDGTFAFSASIPLAHAPRRLAVADLDRDGRPDLIASVGLTPDEGGVLAWTAAGGTLVPLVDLVPVPGAAHIATGDLDRDGDIDIGVTTAGAWVALRNEGGSLHQVAALPSPCALIHASAIADLDADGRADVALACEGDLVLVHDPLGAASRRSLGPAGNLYDILAADLDRDGTVDLAAADERDHVARIWLSPERGSAGAFVHPIARGPIALGAVDIERDGDLDLWVLGYEDRRLDLLENAPRK